jgi:L-malate glycosyltransferase
MQENLVQQRHWDHGYKNIEFKKYNEKDPIASLICDYVSIDKNKSVFEIGCFPGTYLSVFGEMGYKLNGIDLTQGVKSDLPSWLKKEGFKCGDFFCDDFLEADINKKFEIVCSFGFIEHFTDIEDVILKHTALLESEGYLILTTPNFSGFVQYFLHLLVDRKNLKLHNLNIMDPFLWKKILIKQGFQVLYCGWFGGFSFWAEKDDSRNIFQKVLLFFLLKCSGLLNRLSIPNSRHHSPLCGLVVKKNK